MEKVEGGKDHDSGISETPSAPPTGQPQRDPALGKGAPFSGSQRSDSPPRSGPGIAVGEGKSPSPPHSSTTLTTTGSSSGGPSIVGTSNPRSGTIEETGTLGLYTGHQGFETAHFETNPQLLGLPSMEYSDHSRQVQRPIQLYEGRYNPARYPVAIKLLVSNNVAGSIIGRQGQTISELQSRSMTRIKLSQAGDHFPGTHDRVCLIQGDPGNVKTAMRLLLERMFLLHEQDFSQQATWQKPTDAPPPVNFVVRLLVPSASCGMIIGKAGSNIKYLEETAGVLSVRLSPKEGGDQPSANVPAASAERAVTITGLNMESCLQCAFMVFEGMISHPDVSRYANLTTTYGRKSQPTDVGPGPSPVHGAGIDHPHMIPGVMPQAPPPPQFPNLPSAYDQQIGSLQGGNYVPAIGKIPRRALSTPDMGELKYDQQPAEASFMSNLPMISPPLPLEVPLENSPYALSGPPADSFDFSAGSSAGMHHSVSAPDLLAFQLDQTLQFSQQDANSKRSFLVPVAPTCLGPDAFQAQLAVPDSMIGSILGRGGRTLNELQVMSGTRIWISQRGEYVPGTRNRVVTVRGATVQSVWQAQVLISQRVVLPQTAGTSVEQTPAGSPS